ncbi:MAG: hypothetical protein MJ210_02660 [Alphaproteobacteria bacterium]|nr:hypothetical protein [Alphaproteobacteria bacterium]
MKKIICFLLAVLFCGQADAQILSGERDSGVKRISPIKAEQPVSLNMEKANVFSVTTDENQPTDIDEDDEETPPTEVTEEERTALRLEAQKDVQKNLKNRTARERRAIIDALNSTEKMKVRRDALLDGLSEKDAQKAEAEVATPKIDPFNDKDVQEYLFEQSGLNDTKTKNTDNKNND